MKAIGPGKRRCKNELIALVSLIRVITALMAHSALDKTVDKNFQDWVFKQAGRTL
jgi:type I restriction enzyme R subunit